MGPHRHRNNVRRLVRGGNLFRRGALVDGRRRHDRLRHLDLLHHLEKGRWLLNIGRLTGNNRVGETGYWLGILAGVGVIFGSDKNSLSPLSMSDPLFMGLATTISPTLGQMADVG